MEPKCGKRQNSSGPRKSLDLALPEAMKFFSVKLVSIRFLSLVTKRVLTNSAGGHMPWRPGLVGKKPRALAQEPGDWMWALPFLQACCVISNHDLRVFSNSKILCLKIS